MRSDLAQCSEIACCCALGGKRMTLPTQTAAVLLLALGATACVTSRPVALPNGAQGFDINCPGTARDIGDCMNEAARICGGKYQIVDREGNVVGGAAVSAGNNSAVFVQGIHRTMIVSYQQAPSDTH
jgi:hypothetical protein